MDSASSMDTSNNAVATTPPPIIDGAGVGVAGDEQLQHSQLSPASDASTGSHDPGKMFIGGLSWQTTAEGLRDYFGKFGEVNECMVMRDPATKRARGFGFITFADPASVDKVLAQESHDLDGKKIDPKVAFPKRAQPKMITKTKKIFIGGLSATSTVDDMKQYFEQFGKVEDAMLMFDKTTQRHRGFGFITFNDEDVTEKVCEIHFHEINGKMVECKKAQPKEVMLPVQLNKSRAAAARSLYGFGPEQLLAATYASYLPRLGAYGANVLYPIFNGYQTGYAPLTPTSPGGGRPFANAQGTLEALYAAAAAAGAAPSADFNPYGQLSNPQTALPHSFHNKGAQLVATAYNGYH